MKKSTLHNGEPSRTQGWYLNTRRDQVKDPRVREAIELAFDFEWTNKNIMYSAYKRVVSFFPDTDMEAKGKPGPAELELLEPFHDKLPASVFGDPYTPPESDGSGFDRKLLKQAYDLLIAAGCQRDGAVLRLPGGKPLTMEFLDFSSALQPHTMPFIQNLRQARHSGQHPDRRRHPVQGPHRRLRLRRGHRGERRLVNSGGGIKVAFTSEAAARQGSRIWPASPIPSSTRSSRRLPTPNRARR